VSELRFSRHHLYPDGLDSIAVFLKVEADATIAGERLLIRAVYDVNENVCGKTVRTDKAELAPINPKNNCAFHLRNLIFGATCRSAKLRAESVVQTSTATIRIGLQISQYLGGVSFQKSQSRASAFSLGVAARDRTMNLRRSTSSEIEES
jgi:hypothetical protein